MSRFCSHCGQSTRDGDRFCIRCGAEVNANSTPNTRSSPVHGAERSYSRVGGPGLRRRWLVVALLGIAAVVGAAVLANTGSTPSPRQTAEVAPPAAAVKETATVTPSKGRPKADSANKANSGNNVVTATDAHGRTFSCSFAYEGRLNAAHGRVNHRRRTLRTQEAELRKLDEQYPGRTAPAAVADHYNTLAAQARAQVKSTNKAIRAYNQLLIDLCDPT